MARSCFMRLIGILIAVAGAAAGQLQLYAGTTEEEMHALESRIRALEYPELQKRSAEEIAVYKQWASSADQVFQRTDALFKLGAAGGAAVLNAQAELNAELAKIELAWAEGRVEDAYAHSYRAVDCANRYGAAAAAAYETGTITFDWLCDSQIKLAKTKLQLIRTEKVAKAAGVDLSNVKQRESARRPPPAKPGIEPSPYVPPRPRNSLQQH
jgi:hypothetical protein